MKLFAGTKIRSWLPRVLIIVAFATVMTYIVMSFIEAIPGMGLSRQWQIVGPLIAATVSGLVAIKIVSQMVKIESLHHELSQTHQQLEALTSFDQITGLTNRDTFFRTFQPQSRHAGWLILCDVDHFKRINDTHGHACGDQVLAVVGEVIRANIRGGDCQRARIGGEEFVVLLPPMSQTQVVGIAERLRLAIEAKTITSQAGKPISITMSFGVSQRAEASISELLKAADVALYEAKNSGRNRVVLAREAGIHSTLVADFDDAAS